MSENHEAMEFLRKHLIELKEPMVAIVGPNDSGKTTIAMQFGEVFAGEFHRVVRVHVGTDGELSLLDSAHRLRSDQDTDSRPDLLILDAPDPDGAVLKDVSRHISNYRVIAVRVTSVPWGKAPELHLTPRKKYEVIGSGSFTMQGMSEVLLSGEAVVASSNALPDFNQPGILGPGGEEIGSEGQRAIISFTGSINDEFIRKLAEDPKRLYEIHHRKFEELVAELMLRNGYTVELTPASNDGGKDIFVARKTDLGSFLFLVECKHYKPDNPVGVHIVRALYGTVNKERATGGIIATTSRFTKPAMEFQSSIKYQMSLHDYLGIQEWIKNRLKKPLN